MASFKRAVVPFLDCGSSEWHFCHFHFHFLKVRVGLWKVVKRHAKCEMSTLTLNFACSEHHMKISLGFIVAFWFGSPLKKGVWKLYTVNDCLPMSCLKYHDCLWKVSLIKLDTVWLGMLLLIFSQEWGSLVSPKSLGTGCILMWGVEAPCTVDLYGPSIEHSAAWSWERSQEQTAGEAGSREVVSVLGYTWSVSLNAGIW